MNRVLSSRPLDATIPTRLFRAASPSDMVCASLLAEQLPEPGTVSGSQLSLPGQVACTGSEVGSAPVLSCTFGTGTCTSTGTPATLKDATATCCDVGTQDCVGAGMRCTLVGTASNSPSLVAACIPDTGIGNEGDACTRASMDPTDVGHDTCKKGLFCANFGTANVSTRFCRQLCDEDSHCAAGAACREIGGTPTVGVCMPRCSPFANAGVQCGAGNVCHVVYGSLPSAPTGSVTSDNAFCVLPTLKGTAGAACTSPSDCLGGLQCFGSPSTCTPLCDWMHACPAGTCVTLQGLASDAPALGTCQ